MLTSVYLAKQMRLLEHSLSGRMSALGETIGTAGGVVVGTVIAGPIGGMVGAFSGQAFGGQLGADTAVGLNKQVQQLEEGKPSEEVPPQQPDVRNWTVKIASSSVGEMGSALVGGAIGELVASPVGGEIGQSLGTIAGKKIDWSSQSRPTLQELAAQENRQETLPPSHS